MVVDPSPGRLSRVVPPSTQGGWRFTLYPDAAEGGGSFRSAAGPEHRERWSDPSEDSRDDAARRARTRVRRYCAENRLNRLGTLTYRGAGCHDPGQLRADVGLFFRQLRGSLGEPFPYLWVPEWHPGGHGLHAHFAVGRFIGQRLIRDAWGRGFVHIKLLGQLPVGSGTRGEARLAARYLSKYVSKDLGDQERRGLHRYEVAQGFQPTSSQLVGSSWDDVLALAEAIMGARAEHVWHSRDQEDWQGPPAGWASWA